MQLTNPLTTHQQNHFLHWIGDIADTLLLVAIEGDEALSTAFNYRVRSLTAVPESQLVRWHGKTVCCCIGDGVHGLPQRFIHGVVTQIHYRQRNPNEAECILTLEPDLALLRLGRAMRIWQNTRVPDLVRTLLNEYGITALDLQLHGSYPVREYCIQYRESAFDFIQRLLDEEGISYFFRHNDTGHTLVLTDHTAGYRPIPGNTLAWHHQGDIITHGTIGDWSSSAALLPAGVSLQGVNMPQAAAIDSRQDASGLTVTVDNVTFSDITPREEREQISRETRQLMEAREAHVRRFKATAGAHWLCSGETFTLTGHPSGESIYLVKALSLSAVNSFDDNSSDYQCRIEALSQEQTWRPASPIRPSIPGILCATVVGPASEEIHTDQYGRIKIQFPWDKQHPSDDTSSCWVRVVQPWSGGKFGAQFIPRVGSEVLVSFVQGDPDYPLVTGTVYNGQNQPPFTLPGAKSESGFMTRSTPNGSISDGHRLSFNDRKGEELLTIVAQKDLALTVKNDATSTIAANRHTELTRGDDQLVLKQGDMSITLDKGDWQQKITGNATTELNGGDYTLRVAGGGGGIKTDKALTLESTQSIELKVGANKISLSASGIAINGMMVSIKGNGTVELKSPMTTVSGSGMTQITGGIINIG